MKTDGAAAEVNENHANVTIFEDIAEAGHDAIASILRAAKKGIRENFYEAGGPPRKVQSHEPAASAVARKKLSATQ